MSLKEVYTAYLADPAGKSIVLSDDASLKYITTLTTINGATAINKHHAAHEKALKRKEQKILDHVEGGLSLSVDVEITLEFLTGGGAYLPGIDDNFVSDHVVTFPMVCRTFLCLTGALADLHTDPCCPLQCRTPNYTNSIVLGPRLLVKANRCHWCSRPQLADPRWKGSGSTCCNKYQRCACV